MGKESDVTKRFLASEIEARFRMVLNRRYTKPLESYLGLDLFDQYVQLAKQILRKFEEEHLGPKPPTNLIFVPGVMGSLLQSNTQAGVWWLDVRSLNHVNDLQLSDDGQDDINSYHEISAFGVDATYDSFLSIFAGRNDFGVMRLPFDWRKPLSITAAALRAKILETYESNGHKQVHLMAHSMGGLLIRAALMKYGDELWPKVGRIVFLGTPHYGSPAIAGYLKNHLWGFELMALLGLYFSRATYRSMWGVLSMLPAPNGIYPGTRTHAVNGAVIEHPCANFDMYDARAWKLDMVKSDEIKLQRVLDSAADFHRSMFDAHKGLTQEQRGRMAVIAGVGYSTLFRLEFDARFLGIWEHTNKVTNRVAGDPHREGDGRVPLASASLESIGATRYVYGKHGDLPNIVQVYEDALRWLKGEPMKLPDTVPGALSQHLAGPLKTFGPDFQVNSAVAKSRDDPGYWDLNTPDPVRLSNLRQKLEAGQLPEIQFLHLL